MEPTGIIFQVWSYNMFIKSMNITRWLAREKAYKRFNKYLQPIAQALK